MDNAIDLRKYIFLPEKKHGNLEHPPLRVSKQRLSLKDPDPVLRKLDTYEWIRWSAEKHSSPDKSLYEPNGYLGYLDWLASHQVLQNMEPAHIMLPPVRFIDFLQLLSSGEAYDGNGNEVSKKKLGYILEQIIGDSNSVTLSFSGVLNTHCLPEHYGDNSADRDAVAAGIIVRVHVRNQDCDLDLVVLSPD